MNEPSKVEYRVREIKRYVVTRYFNDGDMKSAGVDTRGEYENAEVAFEVGYALCKAEHDRLGWPVGDERIQYPRRLGEAGSLARPVAGPIGSGGKI